MNLIISLEKRFEQTPDGAIWTQTTYPYPFWKRYLQVFEHIQVLARVRPVKSVPQGWKRSDGQGVSFLAIPYYVGLWQYLRKRQTVQHNLQQALDNNPSSAVILRVPSQLGTILEKHLHNRQHPYAVEVVGDPYDVFAPGAITHPLRAFFRWWFTRQLKLQCQKAIAASYVSEYVLQKRYPTQEDAFSTHYSSIELSSNAIVSRPRKMETTSDRVRLVFVGSLEQLYKAPDVLIQAVRICVAQGYDVHLTIIGQGKYQSELEQTVQAEGLENHVQFLGQLAAGDAVREQLDLAHIFILPSKTEGLPRAMIEAMARGLPCIGSTVGGIPELLHAEDMVNPGDVAELARKIIDVMTNPERMSGMSARNLEKAKEYQDTVLNNRRKEFYQYILEKTSNMNWK